jgi:hypothetical protein
MIRRKGKAMRCLVITSLLKTEYVQEGAQMPTSGEKLFVAQAGDPPRGGSLPNRYVLALETGCRSIQAGSENNHQSEKFFKGKDLTL